MPPPRSAQKQPGFRQQSINEKVEEYRSDLDQIELMLEQIKREYELFFVGTRKRPPFEMRTQLERLLRKWRTSTIQKLELTFRLNTLNSKYVAMADVWEKIMKRREADPRALSPFGPSHDKLVAEFATKAREADARAGRGTPAAATAAAARDAAEGRAGAPVDPEQRMRRLFDQYVDAKKDLGETVEAMSFSRFKSQLDKQVESIRQKTNCKDVEFGVIRKDGKVSLTAKPVKS